MGDVGGVVEVVVDAFVGVGVVADVADVAAVDVVAVDLVVVSKHHSTGVKYIL